MRLDRFHRLESGLPVRVRLARSSDRRGIRELLERAQAGVEPIALIHFDPRSRVVVCATALLSGRETVVGVGSIELGAPAPDVLVSDDRAHGVRELLGGVLAERAAELAEARSRSRAA
jgi:hypothetical protein